MSRRVIARGIAALTSASLLLGLLALPVAAGGPPETLRVDDDGVQCPSAAYTSIQDAIDNAGLDDIVIVCPGHYPEQLLIERSMTVRAQPLFQAHIDVPFLNIFEGDFAAVTIRADDVTFAGFRMHFDAGDVPTVRPSALSCNEADAAIDVEGENNTLRYNRMDVQGEQTLTGACGYSYGVVVRGTLNGDASARVTFNKITDFKRGGILVEGDGTNALVRRNAIKFLHPDESAASPCIATGCATSGVRTTGINGALPEPFGIGVEGQADARIVRNAIRSGPNATPSGPIGPEGPPGVRPTGFQVGTPALQAGIAVTNTDSGLTKIKHNAVWRTIRGIITDEESEAVDVFENHLTLNFEWAIVVMASDSFIYDNEVHSNFQGIRVYSSNNSITNNDFRGNQFIDCFDSSSDGGSQGTANTWTDNLGDDDFPDGICDPES